MEMKGMEAEQTEANATETSGVISVEKTNGCSRERFVAIALKEI